jgi:tRNA-binding EMAP/Myf-like protein
MRIPLSWLREFVEVAASGDPTVDAEAVHAALVRVGLEEEEIHGVALTGPIVVGQVLEFVDEPQSNGKIIRWCQVLTGAGETRGIVCGASNFAVGDKVVVSLPGAVLPGPFPISARKTYGHVSDGMIASARELGLGDEHDGILRLATLGLDPEVGTDAIALLGLDDLAVEINVSATGVTSHKFGVATPAGATAAQTRTAVAAAYAALATDTDTACDAKAITMTATDLVPTIMWASAAGVSTIKLVDYQVGPLSTF